MYSTLGNFSTTFYQRPFLHAANLIDNKISNGYFPLSENCTKWQFFAIPSCCTARRLSDIKMELFQNSKAPSQGTQIRVLWPLQQQAARDELAFSAHKEHLTDRGTENTPVQWHAIDSEMACSSAWLADVRSTASIVVGWYSEARKTKLCSDWAPSIAWSANQATSKLTRWRG